MPSLVSMDTSLLNDPDLAKIARLKIARETDGMSQEIEAERRRKKAELAARGLSQSGSMIEVRNN